MSVARKLMGVKKRPEGWDLSNARFTGEPPVGKFSVALQETQPHSLAFKPDGTKMYVVGAVTDSAYEYDLSTAWDVTSASYSSVSFSLSGQDSVPEGITFKPDGTKMYVVGSATDSVYEYDLSTAWDLSTTSYNSVSVSVTAQEVIPNGSFFKPDGTKMYVVGSISDNVLEYNLSTAWDLSSASYSGVSFSVVNEDGAAQACTFKSDGTKMYVLGGLSDTVYEYDLSTAWDISTASYSSVSFSVTSQETSPSGLSFKPDGTKMYVIGAFDTVYEYDLSTAWDISTAAFVVPTTNYFSVSSEDTNPFGLTFDPDGEKMYIVGRGNDTIYEYDLSPTWQVHTASYLQQLSLNAQDANPSEVVFKPDGTKMYMVGVASDSVYEYDLSTAWDISTASYSSVSFSVSTQDLQPTSLSFKPDGTKMYVLGNRNDYVYEYDLSTAWDISSASYNSVSFSVTAQETFPFGLSFKPDGTKMYVVGSVTDSVYEYDLSTAWDISSASYNSVSFSVVNETGSPNALSFRPNGFSMYVVGSDGDAVVAYDL